MLNRVSSFKICTYEHINDFDGTLSRYCTKTFFTLLQVSIELKSFCKAQGLNNSKAETNYG